MLFVMWMWDGLMQGCAGKGEIPRGGAGQGWKFVGQGEAGQGGKACKSTNSQQKEALKMILAASSPFCGRIDICFQRFLSGAIIHQDLHSFLVIAVNFNGLNSTSFRPAPPQSAPQVLPIFAGRGIAAFAGWDAAACFPARRASVV